MKIKNLLLIFILSLVLICFNCKKLDQSNETEEPVQNERFVEHIITSNFNGAVHVYAVDLDKDGDTDVLGASFRGNTVACWENTGNGGFEKKIIANIGGARVEFEFYN